MKENLTAEDITQDVIDAVTHYLAKRATAEVLREKVNAVEAEVLKDVALFDDLRARHEDREAQRITEPRHTYLSEDEEALDRYYDAVDAALRDAGLKPAEMDRDYCPALVAEHDQLLAERAILDAAAKMLQMDFDGNELNNRLLCDQKGKGLERRQEFLDLVVKLVVNLPTT